MHPQQGGEFGVDRTTESPDVKLELFVMGKQITPDNPPDTKNDKSFEILIFYILAKTYIANTLF